MKPPSLFAIALAAAGTYATSARAQAAAPTVDVKTRIVRGEVQSFDRVAPSLENAVAPCYRSALVEYPRMKGQVTLALRIDEEGRVEHLSRRPSGTVTSKVAKCVESKVSSARMGSSEKGWARVLLTFRFQPGEKKPPADEQAPKVEEPERETGPEFHGYLQPSFGYKSRPDAVPRDRTEYGAYASKAGFSLEGERFEHWHYKVHLVVDARAIAVLTDVALVDRDGGGDPERVDATQRDLTATLIEEVSVRYQPFEFIGVTAGQMRIPFTVAHQSANTALMFPTRAGPNEVFLSGSDRGMLGKLSFLDGRTRASFGAFHGGSLLLSSELKNTRGLVYSMRTDVEPLGELPGTENDFERGPFRFGLGFGLLYRNANVYDSTGYEATVERDVRVSASLRAMFAGIYLQSEFLRRQQTDNLSSRPQQTTGYYGQASYYLPLGGKVALSPIARVGKTIEDETVKPLETLFIEGGLAFFPAADQEHPNDLRILLQYVGERRISEEGENAHGATGQISYRW